MSTQARPSTSPNDPPTAETRKLRKRIQNRVNQRAHRQRLRDARHDASSGRNPFRVDRWRLDGSECRQRALNFVETTTRQILPTMSEIGIVEFASSSSSPDESETDTSASSVISTGPEQTPVPASTLYADLLLHLVYHNMFRAFVLNAGVLDMMTAIAHPRPLPKPPAIYRKDLRCSLVTTIHQINPHMPSSLQSTPLQATKAHSFWINVIPFARMRDHLIQHEACFDHREFLQDLLGWPLVEGPSPSPPEETASTQPCGPQETIEEEDTGDVTTGSRGFIVWGEAHDKRNWEATPGFFAKWAWTVDGCEELLETSNNWRLSREEEPISISSTGHVSLIHASEIPLVMA